MPAPHILRRVILPRVRSLATYLPVALGTPYLAVGNRRLVPGATEAMQVRATAGGADAAIGFDAGGGIDVAAIGTVAARALVNRWSDQSGNGRHLTFTGTTSNSQTPTRPVIDAARSDYAASPIIFANKDSNAAPIALRDLRATGLALNPQAYSIYVVMNCRESLQSNAHIQLRSAGARAAFVGTIPGNAGLVWSNLTTNYSPGNQRPRGGQLSCHGFVSSAAGRTLYIRGGSQSAVAHSGLSTIDELILGSYDLASSYNTRADWLALVVYPVAHTAIEAQAAIDALSAIFAVPTLFTSRLVGIGDSHMESIYTERGYFDMLDIAGIEKFNCGIGGQLVKTQESQFANYYAGLYSSAVKTAFLCLAGGNDLSNLGGGGTGDNAANVETYDASILSKIIATGANARHVLGTVQNRAGGSGFTTAQQTELAALNTFRKANSQGWGAVVDLQSISEVSVQATAPSTYAIGDGVHWTQAGHAAEMPYIRAALNVVLAT